MILLHQNIDLKSHKASYASSAMTKLYSVIN